MTWVARRPAAFSFVEGGEELESVTYSTFPAEKIDRLCQLPYRVGSEIPFVSLLENLCRILVVLYRGCHQQHRPILSVPRDGGPVVRLNRACSHLCKVVHVSTESCSAISCKLF